MPHHRKTIIALWCLFVFAFGASALRASPPIGAVVQTWHYDPLTNIVTLKIVNTSHKNITAFNIAIKETYADGHVSSHEQMTDSSGALAVIEEVKGTADEDNLCKQVGDGVLHPGETRKEIIHVQPGLTTFEATVDVVAYADQTSEATNNDGLQRLISRRKVNLASRQACNEIIKAALADPHDPDPAATATKKIQDRITIWKSQKHTTLDFEPAIAKGIVDELNGISSKSSLTNKRDALTRYIAKSEKRIATLSPHANLTKIGGPQT